MRIEIVPFKPIHAHLIIERNIREQNIWLSKSPDWEKWIKSWEENGPAYTLIIDDEIVFCAGVILLDSKKGQTWTLLSSLFHKYKKTSFKSIKNYLDAIIKDKKLIRVDALVFDGYGTEKICGNFLEHLKFEWEAKLKRYGPAGEDMHMYTRLT